MPTPAQSSSTYSSHEWLLFVQLTIAQRNVFCRRSTRMNGRQRSAWRAGVSGGIAGHRCWFNGFNASLPVQDCWIWAAEEDKMRTVSISEGTASWVWIGQARYSQRGGVDILYCPWSA